MTIPIIITVRKQSQRCPNKMLREFYRAEDGTIQSLLDVCLNKFTNDKNVYVAGFEKEFEEIAQKHGVNFIQRTEESALSEDPVIIHSYLREHNFDKVCLLNSCCPMVKIKTVYDALETFEKLQASSLFSVKKSHDIIFNNNLELINSDRVFNSKIRKASYICNNVMVVFSPDYFFKNGTYCSYTHHDPYLYCMGHDESVDVDTELDFKIARIIYQSLYQKHS